MGTLSALLAICAGNSPVPGEFPAQRPVTRSFDVFFDLHPNERLNKQWWGWWFETPSCPLWRHRNGVAFVSSKHGQRERWAYCFFLIKVWTKELQRRHNERDGVSRHRRLDYLFKCLLRRWSKKTPKLHVIGRNAPVTGGFPWKCYRLLISFDSGDIW